MSTNAKAYPLADGELTSKLLDLIQLCSANNQLRKGANETTKALNRGRSELVILAADAEPPEILLHLPILCEDKNVPYIYVESKMALGRACGVSRAVISCCITVREGSNLTTQLNEIRSQVEATLV